MNDQRLLRNFVEQGSQQAFAELSQRHMGLVFSTCYRELEDNDLAQDATQAVFLLMAQKAKSLCRHPHIPGWLFHTSRFVAKNVRKTELLRRRHEEAMIEQITKSDYPNEPEWNAIDPLLNNALAALKTLDRDAILLRYFEGRTLADVGAILGVSEDGARKRIERALEKMRTHFKRHDIAVTISALSLLLAAHAAKAVPAGCVAAVKSFSASTVAGGVAFTHASPHIAHIAQGAIKSMKIASFKTAASIGVASLAIGGTVQHIAVAQYNAHKPAQVLVAAQTPATEKPTDPTAGIDPQVLTILNKVQHKYASAKTLTADTLTTISRNNNVQGAIPGVLRLMRPNFAENEETSADLNPTSRVGSDGVKCWDQVIYDQYYYNQSPEKKSALDGSNIFDRIDPINPKSNSTDPKSAFFNVYSWLKRSTEPIGGLKVITDTGKEDVDDVTYDVLSWTDTRQQREGYVFESKLYIGDDNLIHQYSNTEIDRGQNGAQARMTFTTSQRFDNIQLNTPLKPASFAYIPPAVPLRVPPASSTSGQVQNAGEG
ncbi:MAG: sigma-70 family RNA polymerase sigma factor [Capsulimonas sp.]|uniref:RNA polymerase sigma factor n=1 Tax=Capsulimonas sp. TaxID=2494211 RepID=UPI003267B172